MTITTGTSRKIFPTALAAALAGLLMVSGCTKQTDENAETRQRVKQKCKAQSQRTVVCSRRPIRHILTDW